MTPKLVSLPFKAWPILHNYKSYDKLKKGLFSVPKIDGKYSLSDGWENVEEEVSIIGEDDDTYVYKLLPTIEGKWVGKKVIHEEFLLPIGIHKSRLVKWI